jgi:hypothetical protein
MQNNFLWVVFRPCDDVLAFGTKREHPGTVGWVFQNVLVGSEKVDDALDFSNGFVGRGGPEMILGG